MTFLRRIRRWLAGPARARRLHRLRRQRHACELPGVYAAACKARAECEADIDRTPPGFARWRLRCERRQWDGHIANIRATASRFGVRLTDNLVSV